MFARNKVQPPKSIAIDPGQSQTRFYSPGEGLLLDEPSLGLLDMDHGDAGASAVHAFGHSAVEAATSSASQYRLIRPLQADALGDLGISARMLYYFLHKASRAGLTGKSPLILLARPDTLADDALQAMRQMCRRAGAASVQCVEKSLATANGVSLPLDGTNCPLLLDLGASDSRLYAFANGQQIFQRHLSCGGDALDAMLVEGVRNEFSLHISDSVARHAKHRCGGAVWSEARRMVASSCQIQGLEITTNRDRTLRLSADTAYQLMLPGLKQMRAAIAAAMAELRDQHGDRIAGHGLLLTGGGVLLPNIDQLVMEASGTTVEIAPRPLSSTARGTAAMMNQFAARSGAVETA